jgi:solute carrier family 40 (iron-regulated transporter), member 1
MAPEPDYQQPGRHHEATLLLPGTVPETENIDQRKVLRRLYLSHFLSTWSSRMFEFGAVLFLASIFSGTLLYASVYALTRALTVACLSSWLGSYIDQWNRLTVMRHSIGMERT